MLRLTLRPLVPDFGETLEHPLQVVDPSTSLKFTRDYRIFEQFENFPDKNERTEGVQPTVRAVSLPKGLKVIRRNSDDKVVRGRRDNAGLEITTTTVADLKTIVLPTDTSPVNKGIMAYIHELPDNVPVIMEWD